MIVTSGKYSENDVKIIYQSRKIDRTQKELAAIDSIWQEEKQKGYTLYDGKMVSVLDLRADSDIKIIVCNSTYKEFVGTRSQRFIDEFGTKSVVNPLSVGSMLRTSDNKLIFAKRSSKIDLSKGKLSIASGWIDPSLDASKNQINVFDAVKREIHEELAIKPDEVANMVCLGIIRNSSFVQTFLPFFADTIDSESLLQRRHGSEFDKIVLVENAKESFEKLKKEDLSDVARPTLELYEKITGN